MRPQLLVNAIASEGRSDRMVHQDLDLAAAARVAVEEARYRDRYRTDADSLATPQPDPRTRRDVPLHPRRLRENCTLHM